MLIRRSLRRATSSLLAAAVLFTQFATSAHACPMLSGTGGQAAHAPMPCAGMDEGTAMPGADPGGVCQQHCQFGTNQQAAEPLQLQAAPAPLPALLFVLAGAEPQLALLPHWRIHERVRERAPPLDVRVAHCCYRL